jgi:predicted metal-dependent hydrolase
MFVVDSVIVHALAHLLEQNHTALFWNIVQVQVPGYVKAKEWLKQHWDILESGF